MWHVLQSSLDRGFGRCSVLRAQKGLIKRHPNNLLDRIVRPVQRTSEAPLKGSRSRAKERALDSDGIAAVGGHIRAGDGPGSV
jgi:DNA-directed RNA polymerase III subunit RPC2